MSNFNDKYINLIIKGYVVSTVGKLRSKIGPLSATTNVLDFKEIIQGFSENETIIIFNSSEDTVLIKPLYKHEQIEVEVEPQILEPDQSGEITININTTNCELGELITICDFDITKKKNKYRGQLSILANVIEDFSLLTEWELINSPVIYTASQKIELQKIQPNKLKIKEVEIENRGKRELLIHNIKTSNSMYLITPKKLIIRSGEKGTFQLSIKPTITRNNVISKLTIISNDPNQSILNLKISGKVNQPEENSSENIVSEIDIEEAKILMENFKGQDEFVILDVRTEEEYNSGCLEDAINIDYYNPDFQNILNIIDKQKTYLIYCLSGVRSKSTFELMSKMSFKYIYHMHEGIEGWKAQRLKLTNPQK